MQLTLREAAEYLDVSAATLRRWISEKSLPVHHADERVYLNAVELWEWAVENGVQVSRRLLDHARSAPEAVPPMSALLRSGGIHYDIEARDKRALLREFVARLPLPPDQNRGALVSALEAREAMGSTGIGNGIAIPHLRHPNLLHVQSAFVTLGLLRHPIDFEALDGTPVHALFMVVSPTAPMHLRILSQLGFLLRDDVLRALFRQRAPAEEILTRIARLETTRATGSFTNGSAPGPSRPP
jgi:PTS system nitrogen regulatory IIA component